MRPTTPGSPSGCLLGARQRAARPHPPPAPASMRCMYNTDIGPTMARGQARPPGISFP